MRRIAATATLAGLLLILAAPTGRAISARHDSVTGTARHLGADPPFPAIEVRVHAQSDASGGDPRGFLVVTNTAPLASYRGQVTCMRVEGSRATVGIGIVKSTDPVLLGRGQLWSFFDGGPTAVSDRIAGYPITPTAPTVCPSLAFTVPVIAGNYIVGDALASAAFLAAAPSYTIDELRVTPPIGQFGGIKVGSCMISWLEGCKVQTFTLTNTGSQPILFGGFGLISPINDVSLGEVTCTLLSIVEVDGQHYLSLTPGEACEISVGMATETAGRVERTLEAWYDDQFNPLLVVPLRAVGIE
jgi:hypothetical protein